MTRSLRTIVGTVVAAAATATLVWMPTVITAGIVPAPSTEEAR